MALNRGRYNTTPPSYSSNSPVDLQVDTNGRLKTNLNGFYGTATFTPSASAYGAADIYDVAKEMSLYQANGELIPSGSLIKITHSLLKIDATALVASEGAYTLYAYSVTPPSAQADNAAWTLASADLPSYLGAIAIGTPVDLGAALFVRTNFTDVIMRLAGTSFFLELVQAAAITPAAVARQVTLIGEIV